MTQLPYTFHERNELLRERKVSQVIDAKPTAEYSPVGFNITLFFHLYNKMIVSRPAAFLIDRLQPEIF